MEKVLQEEKKQQNNISDSKSCSTYYGNSTLWDCGSSLYDSFELDSFKSRINSAIASSPRSLSMSHLPERRFSLHPLPQTQEPSSSIVSKKPFKFSRSFHKLLRSVFKSSSNKSTMSTTTNTNNTTHCFQVPAEKYSKERFYVVYDKSGPVLSTIPEEVPEFEIGALSPEISSFVRRSSSERFAATTAIGISCA